MPYIANPLEGLPIRNSFITDQALLGAAPAADDTLIVYDLSATALKQVTITYLQDALETSPQFTGVPVAPTATAGTNTTQLATTAFVTTAVTAENTLEEDGDVTLSSLANLDTLQYNGSAWVNRTKLAAGLAPFPTGGTYGTAAASSALVTDASTNIAGIAALTASGIIKTDSTTNATSTTDGSLQTDGGLSVALDAVIGDDLKLLSDSAVLSFGADSDTTLTHTDGTGIGLNGTNKITFNDASQFIQGASNAILALGATDEIDLTATAIDINGTLDVSGVVDFNATVDMNTNDIDNAGSITFVAETDNGDSGNADTITWTAAQKQKSNLTDDCTFTFVAPAGPCNLILKLEQGTGFPHTVTWPTGGTGVKWPSGTAPTLSTGDGDIDIIALYYDGTAYYGLASLDFS